MHDFSYIGPGMGTFNPHGHIEDKASVVIQTRQAPKVLTGRHSPVQPVMATAGPPSVPCSADIDEGVDAGPSPHRR